MDRTWCADPVNFSCLVCPVGSLLGGRPWVSTRKWGLAFSFPFSSASVFAAFKRLKNCFKGWSLVRPSVSLRHMHHCMSMNALEQGLLGLEAAKASDIDDFV